MKLERTFESSVIQKILSTGLIKKEDSVLVVCGGLFDKKLMDNFGFKNYLITSNVDPKKIKGIKKYSKEDAQNLSFLKDSFDVVMVVAGLHHCSSPHQALCEMYRVSKKRVLVFESQDSFIMRFFVKLGLAEKHERSSSYGVDSTEVPNYIYRWTKREVEKTISSYNPPLNPKIKYFSRFNFFDGLAETAEFKKSFLFKKMDIKNFRRIVGKSAEVMLNLFFKNQGNGFCFIIDKKPFVRKNIK